MFFPDLITFSQQQIPQIPQGSSVLGDFLVESHSLGFKAVIVPYQTPQHEEPASGGRGRWAGLGWAGLAGKVCSHPGLVPAPWKGVAAAVCGTQPRGTCCYCPEVLPRLSGAC